jgi:hypothetical protein
MNLYWIGARQWDIINNNMFVGSITRYGNDNGLHYSFCNNKFTKNFNEFISTKIQHILSSDEDAFFMFANEKNAYQFGKDVFERSICVNPLHIIESMNDKIFTRNFFTDCVKTPNSILINSESCTNYKFISEIFNKKYSTFVLQEAKGAGGLRNYFLSSNYTPHIPPDITYMLVTPYFDPKTTINVHIVTSGKTYKILPPSVQITLNKFKYSGSDFIAYSNLPKQIKSKVFSCAEKIAQKVISIGAKGIFGVDLLILENDVIFLECNYRYQGSSFILNKGLIDAGYPSVFELRYNSFYNDLTNVSDNIYYTYVPLSSFRRTKWNENITLPTPIEILASNDSDFASNDNYIRYELFNNTVIQSIEKQEAQNLY